MLKILAAAALVLSVSAFLFESHSLIWLVVVVCPGAVAVLRGARKAGPTECPTSLEIGRSTADVRGAAATTPARLGRCAR